MKAKLDEIKALIETGLKDGFSDSRVAPMKVVKKKKIDVRLSVKASTEEGAAELLANIIRDVEPAKEMAREVRSNSSVTKLRQVVFTLIARKSQKEIPARILETAGIFSLSRFAELTATLGKPPFESAHVLYKVYSVTGDEVQMAMPLTTAEKEERDQFVPEPRDESRDEEVEHCGNPNCAACNMMADDDNTELPAVLKDLLAGLLKGRVSGRVVQIDASEGIEEMFNMFDRIKNRSKETEAESTPAEPESPKSE